MLQNGNSFIPVLAAATCDLRLASITCRKYFFCAPSIVPAHLISAAVSDVAEASAANRAAEASPPSLLLLCERARERVVI